MQLTDPFALLTPTLDAPVLAALLTVATVDSGAEIHRRAGAGSAHGVRKVLRRMVDQGIVENLGTDAAPLYRLNREHIAYDAIVALGQVREVLLGRLREELERWPQLVHASLPPFGPGNPNKAHPDTIREARAAGRLYAQDEDADFSAPGVVRVVAVVEDHAAIDTAEWRYAEDQLSGNVLAWTGNPLALEVLTADEFDRRRAEQDPVLRQWQRTSVHLAGARLDELMGR